MTKVTIYRDAEGVYTGFSAIGHAGADIYGKDIVCAALSMLTINTANAIDMLTSDSISVDHDKTDGRMRCRIAGHDGGPVSEQSRLLMQSYEMGVKALSEQYDEVELHICPEIQEV